MGTPAIKESQEYIQHLVEQEVGSWQGIRMCAGAGG